MKRTVWMIPVMGIALCLTACLGAGTSPSTAGGPAAVTGLDRTLIDDKAVDLAFDALDVAATAVDGLLVLKRITPGTPRADAIATSLDTALYWLKKARVAQRAGQSTSYQEAVALAAGAFKHATDEIAAAKGGK